jgi:thioesterase domain-containing protein
VSSDKPRRAGTIAVDGDHYAMLGVPNVASLARHLAGVLRPAQACSEDEC